MKRLSVENLIAGAGISGCATAQKLQDEGKDYLIIDMNIEPGGLTRSISIGDTLFDYTGHFLHLSKWKSPSDIPYANQNDEEWQIVDRRSTVYLNDEWIPAPFQYNLFHLPEKLREKCIESYRNRPKNDKQKDFRQYLLSSFGEEICNLFLYPYNEKILDIDPGNLSLDAVKRFFPAPSKDRVEQGYEKGDLQKRDYNSRFWYPKKNGIGLLARGLAKGLTSTLYGEQVTGIDLNDKVVHTENYKIYYKKLISSIPLKDLCLLSVDSDLKEMGNNLSHNRVLSLNIISEGELYEKLRDVHWIYVPDKEIPFYRIGIYSNIPESHFHSGQNAFYIETSVHYKNKPPALTKVITGCIEKLDELGWIERERIKIVAANWIDCAYVHFDHERKSNVEKIISKLNEQNVIPIGRYGLWDYISMEDSIISGLNSV